MPAKQIIGFILIGILLISGLLLTVLMKPIVQVASYHLFSDSRRVLSIPNFYNVVSNLPFLLIGVVALQRLLASKLVILNEFRLAYLILFIGVILVALGSSYYHLWPMNQTLVWDRIPMTIVFMSLFSIIVAEFISIRIAKLIFWPLLILGVSSVIYWQLGDKTGYGDLRFYGLVQFLPIMMMPILLICFDPLFSHKTVYWCLLGLYLLAKLFEHFDERVYFSLEFTSGHSIKHLLAAFAIWLLLYGYSVRKKL